MKVTTSLITSEEILTTPNNQMVIVPKSGQNSNGQLTTNKCVAVHLVTLVGNSNKLGIKPLLLTITSKLVPISEEVVPSMLMVITMPPKNTISGGLVIGTTMVS